MSFSGCALKGFLFINVRMHLGPLLSWFGKPDNSSVQNQLMDFQGSLQNTLLAAIFKDGHHIFTKMNGVRKYWITIHQNVL